MSIRAQPSSRLWSIVLAGGEGERVRPFVQRWLGYHKPKPYCAFVGNRSMLQHTVDRAIQLAPPSRTVAIVAREHRREALAQLRGRQIEAILLQPVNRDTGPGIFLPLTYIRAHDRRATVVIYPSDHFVYPEDRFLEVVALAVRSAERLHDRVVLLGVQPDRLELDYGWIEPGQCLTISGSLPVRAVSRFVEKPTVAQADEVLSKGAMWNTLVMAAKLDSLWQLGWQCFPKAMLQFERLSQAIGTPEETGVLEDLYQEMPAENFSSDLLERVPEHVAVIELSAVLWSDWGKPERIAETLRRIGRPPAFPLECLDPPFAPAHRERERRLSDIA